MIKYYMVYRFYIFLLHINCTHTKQKRNFANNNNQK